MKLTLLRAEMERELPVERVVEPPPVQPPGRNTKGYNLSNYCDGPHRTIFSHQRCVSPWCKCICHIGEPGYGRLDI